MLPLKRIKENPNIYLIGILLLIHVVYARLLFHPGMHKTHDGELHTARIAAYNKAFSDLHIPPRWAGFLNYGYGTPLVFHYPLPNYIGSALHVIGISYELSFKMLLGISFVVASVGFYLWMTTFFPTEISLTSAIAYGLAPYKFLDLYVRGAVGELFAFVFIPFILFFIEKVRKKKFIYIYIAGITYAMLIISHSIFSLIATPVLLLYSLWRLRENEQGFNNAIAIILIGLTVSAFFWIPALAEQKYTNSDVFIGSKYTSHFVRPLSLVFSEWGYGPDVNSPGGLSPQIGIVLILLAAGGLIVRVKETSMKWLYYGAVTLFFLSVFFSTQYSSIFWSILPFISKFEFPWRFTAFSSFSAAIIGAFALNSMKNKYLPWIFILLLLISGNQFVKVSGYESKNDTLYESFEGSTDFGAATPVWTAGDPSDYPEKPIVIFGEDGEITNFIKSSARQSFTVQVNKEATVLANTLYFPGWKAFVDGKKTPIEFQNQLHRGLITFTVPSGKHSVDIVFTESPVRFLSNVISSAALIALTLLVLRRIRSNGT